MISRLTAIAATFAVLATASLAFASGAASQHLAVAKATATTAVAAPMQVVQLERVVVTGKRVLAASL